MKLRDRIRGWLGFGPPVEETHGSVARGRVDHVAIVDGTMSTLEPGEETNAGLTYKLLCELDRRAHLSLYYEAGVQWPDWSHTMDVIEGRGINRQIRRVYGHLASRYRPGDRIFLFGYSRGAFAVRSLAGVIDRVGLLRAECATERNVALAYRHYQSGADSDAARAFAAAHCHPGVEIEFIGVWDTVKALGLRAPIVWRTAEARHAFHNHDLGRAVRRGFHALALDETRVAFAPVMWTRPDDWTGEMVQMWFRGSHGDVGGQLTGFKDARPLSNIPLVWMLEQAERAELSLPDGWRAQFPTDAQAPSVGTLRGWGKLFLARKRRVVGADPSERIHPSVPRETVDGIPVDLAS